MNLITDPVAKFTGRGRWGKEKRSGASNQMRRWVDGQRDERSGAHVPLDPFTQRLRSMLTLVTVARSSLHPRPAKLLKV
jgi:hypothetical protein